MIIRRSIGVCKKIIACFWCWFDITAYIVPFRVKAPINSSWTCNNTHFYEQEVIRPLQSLQYQRLYADFLSEELIFAYQQPHQGINHSTVSTAKWLAFLFWYSIDTLHNIINGYEIACIWNSEYNVHACMIQKMLILYYKNLLFLFLVDFKLRKSSLTITAACNVLEFISVRVVLCTICLTRYFVPYVALWRSIRLRHRFRPITVTG